MIGRLLGILLLTSPLAADEFTLVKSATIPLGDINWPHYLSPLADLNGDGSLDFIVHDSVFLGNGDGTFRQQVVADEALDVTGIGDLNGDGRPDLLAMAPYDRSGIDGARMEVRKNVLDANGDLSFPVIRAYDLRKSGLDLPYISASRQIADVTGDGMNDLVAIGEVLRAPSSAGCCYFIPLVWVAPGLGNETFGDLQHFQAIETDSVGRPVGGPRSPPAITIADLDGDGFPDIAIPINDDNVLGRISILLNDGAGGFRAPRTIVLPDESEPDQISVVDVDGDALPDLIVGQSDAYAFEVLINQGGGSFEPKIRVPTENPDIEPSPVFPQDLNKDGKLDAIILSGHLELYFSFLDTTERVRSRLEGIGGYQMQTGDLNGDGLADVLVIERGFDETGRRVVSTVTVLLGRLASDFVRGDANADGEVNISDAMKILAHLFLGEAASSCLDRDDVDDNGRIQITDAVSLLNWLFRGGPSPPAPFPNAGQDPTLDANACVASQ